jgi:hypothetical protein
MKVAEVKEGFKFQHGIRGEGEVIKKTPRTITVKFEKSTVKTTYRYTDVEFSPTDF